MNKHMKTPEVAARLVGKQLVVKCPYCGAKHYHGTAVYGHRISHCRQGPGYRLVPVRDAQDAQDARAVQ